MKNKSPTPSRKKPKAHAVTIQRSMMVEGFRRIVNVEPDRELVKPKARRR